MAPQAAVAISDSMESVFDSNNPKPKRPANFIMQMRPLFAEEEKKAVCEYMDEDGFITEFKRTQQFEGMLAEHCKVKHCVVVNNGTIAITLAGLAVGLAHGDEVIVPNYTMIATPNAVKMFGARPVFVDVDKETLCLDLEKTRAAITEKTKAIIFVAANGRYPRCGIDAFAELCRERGLFLIEDAAQALGSIYPDGKHIGTVGLVGTISFSAPKIISTGQGGCVITNDHQVATKLRRLKDFGRAGGGCDIHDCILGLNSSFIDKSEFNFALGLELKFESVSVSSSGNGSQTPIEYYRTKRSDV
jgi:perosamine synthetase